MQHNINFVTLVNCFSTEVLEADEVLYEARDMLADAAVNAGEYNTDRLLDALNGAYDDNALTANAQDSMGRDLLHTALDAYADEDYGFCCVLLARAMLARAYVVDVAYC